MDCEIDDNSTESKIKAHCLQDEFCMGNDSFYSQDALNPETLNQSTLNMLNHRTHCIIYELFNMLPPWEEQFA